MGRVGMFGLIGFREEELSQLEDDPNREQSPEHAYDIDLLHQFDHVTIHLIIITLLSFLFLTIYSCKSSQVLFAELQSQFEWNMLGLFFEKGEKVTFLPGVSFQRVTNNLDSHYYVLQRVKTPPKDYLQLQYFGGPHPQLIEYYTAWQEKQMILEETPLAKKPTREKKGIMGGLLNKKSKAEGLKTQSKRTENKEEAGGTMVEEQVLYVQLQSFSEVKVPTQLQEVREFMALIYLLSMRVFEKFGSWPQMIPVITESRRYKFIKRGGKVEEQLVRLFHFIYREERMQAVASWSEAIAGQLAGLQGEEERMVLGSFLKGQLQGILEGEFSLRARRGQEWQVVRVCIEDAFTLVVKELGLQLSLEEYQVNYYHQDSQTRQIMMQHNIEPPLVLEGNRSNLIIKYLKQFVIG